MDITVQSHGGFVGALQRVFSACGELWCTTFHQKISTPMCGHYRCLTCNRIYPVLWESPRWVAPAISPPASRTGDKIAGATSPYRSTV